MTLFLKTPIVIEVCHIILNIKIKNHKLLTIGLNWLGTRSKMTSRSSDQARLFPIKFTQHKFFNVICFKGCSIERCLTSATWERAQPLTNGVFPKVATFKNGEKGWISVSWSADNNKTIVSVWSLSRPVHPNTKVIL